MADLQGLFHYPGIQHIISGTYTLSHGITPGVATLQIAPQRNFPTLVGRLRMTFAGWFLDFRDMKIDKHSFTYDENGLVISLSLLDRRWKWRFGEWSARYNIREADKGGEIDPPSDTSSRVIADDLFDAMGETVYDVGHLPEEPRPELTFDVQNPAQALAELADMFGCRVVLGLDNVVKLWRGGVGAALPRLNLMADGLTLDPPERPDRIGVMCGPTLYQADMLLEPVGTDTNGEIVPIDELSYAPEDGWENSNPLSFKDIGDTTRPYDYRRELAMQSVYRMYRIATETGIDGEPFFVPGRTNGEPIKHKQLLPIDDHMVETETHVDGDGRIRTERRPAQVWGTYYFAGPPRYAGHTPEPINDRPVPNSMDPKTHYKKAFTIDKERGIVKFSEPVYRFDDDVGEKTYHPARIALRTAVVFRGTRSRMPDRYYRVFAYPPPLLTTPDQVLRHDELVRKIFPGYSVGDGLIVPGELYDNVAQLDLESDYYIEGEKLKYRQEYPQEIKYMGLIPINLDGAIQQVTWTVGPQGATTQASRNTEHSYYLPPYAERRFLELLWSGRWQGWEAAAKRMRQEEYFRRRDNA